jgi:choloylglycine hydrolase
MPQFHLSYLMIVEVYFLLIIAISILYVATYAIEIEQFIVQMKHNVLHLNISQMRSLQYLLFILAITSTVFTCTDFRYPVGNKLIYSARTMDFPTLEFTQLRLIPEGVYYESKSIYQGVSWITNVGYLSLTSYGINKTVDGLNQCGLSCALLTLMETEYQTVTDEKQALAMTDVCDWILGQFCNTQDIEYNMKNITVYRDYLIKNIPCPLLHISIHDAANNSLVIEFIKGKQVFHNNFIGILTNDPTYDWHIKNVQNYNYINNVAPTGSITINNFEFNASYYGYPVSNFGISSDDGPVSRFVRISQLIRYMTIPQNNQQAILMGYHLLEKVSVVPGFSKVYNNNKYLTDVTIYRIIRDHTNLRFYFVTYNDLTMKMVDLNTNIYAVSPNRTFVDNPYPYNFFNITSMLL